MTSTLERSLETAMKNIELKDISLLDDKVPAKTFHIYSSFGEVWLLITNKLVERDYRDAGNQDANKGESENPHKELFSGHRNYDEELRKPFF